MYVVGMQGLTSLPLTPLNRRVAADATPCHAVRPAASDIEAGKDALADTDALIKHRPGRFLQGFILVCLRYTGCRGSRNAGGSYRKHHRGSCWCRFGFMKTWATLPLFWIKQAWNSGLCFWLWSCILWTSFFLLLAFPITLPGTERFVSGGFRLGLWLRLCSCGCQTRFHLPLMYSGVGTAAFGSGRLGFGYNAALILSPLWSSRDPLLVDWIFPYWPLPTSHSWCFLGVRAAISMALKKLASFHGQIQPCKSGGPSRLVVPWDGVQNVLNFTCKFLVFCNPCWVRLRLLPLLRCSWRCWLSMKRQARHSSATRCLACMLTWPLICLELHS